MRRLAAVIACSLVTSALLASAAGAQSIDPRRIASCQLAAENMRDRVQPGTDSRTQYEADASYWSGQVQRFVPEASQRESLIGEGRNVLSQALAQRDYLSGMAMVSQVLGECNANRSYIEGVNPNG